MSILDIILIIFFCVGIFSGYRKGFLVSLFSLLAIFLGILAGFKLMGIAMLKLNQLYSMDEKILPYAAFALVFIIVVIVVNLLGKLLRSTLEKTLLGSADQFAGGVLGLLRMAFMISVLFWILDALTVPLPYRWTDQSVLYPYTARFAPAVADWVGDWLPVFRDLFHLDDTHKATESLS